MINEASAFRLAVLSSHVAPSQPTPTSVPLPPSLGVGQPMGSTSRQKRQPVLDALEFMKLEEFLTPKERQFRRRVRKIAEEEIAPLAKRMAIAGKNVDTKALVSACRNIGPAGLQISEHGAAGLSFLESLLLTIEMCRVDASAATFYLVHSALGMQSINVAGTEAQRRYWLPRMARYEAIGAFALTEPDHGSNATGLKTTATKVPGGWVLNGRKRWIGNATWADVTIVWARNSETKTISGYLVQKGTPGFKTSLIEGKMSLRGVENADIDLVDCFIPDECFLSAAPDFSRGTNRVLESSRAVVAAGAAGLLLGAYDRAVKYCVERQQFGRPIASFQLVQERLMRVLGIVQSSVLSIVHLGRMLDKGLASMAHIALVKAWITRYGREGVALCRESVGGNGIVWDYGVMGPFLDMESLYTYEGTYDVNMLLAGRLVTGLNAMN